MAEVGHVTPGKPIWPEHHGELPERPAPRKEDEQPRKRPPRAGDDEPPAPSEDERGGHVDEYV
jgi:hypothetical protein